MAEFVASGDKLRAKVCMCSAYSDDQSESHEKCYLFNDLVSEAI